MDNPKYVLRTNEAIGGPENLSSREKIIKYGTIAIVAVLSLGSIVFRENLFAELSWISILLLIFLVGKVIFMGAKERVPSPLEIRFYEDYLVVYRDKRYRAKGVWRRELDKFFYKDIKRIEFQKKTQRMGIYGIVEGICYNFNKDGSVSMQPSYHKTTDSFCYFYTSAAKDVDFVAEIERHSPIKVTIKDF